jgi:hypothetical protein
MLLRAVFAVLVLDSNDLEMPMLGVITVDFKLLVDVFRFMWVVDNQSAPNHINQAGLGEDKLLRQGH